jgi:hypothetical protein
MHLQVFIKNSLLENLMDTLTSLGCSLVVLLVAGLLVIGLIMIRRSSQTPDSQNLSNQTPLTYSDKTQSTISTVSKQNNKEFCLMEANGVGGRLELYQTKIRIVRRGFLAFANLGLTGDKEIFIHQISSIQLKNAGGLTNGYIQFAFMGGLENKGGIFDATKDENTIFFSTAQASAFIAIKSAIETRIAAAHAPASSTISVSEEIERFASLRDRKIITEEEFQVKKKQLLG